MRWIKRATREGLGVAAAIAALACGGDDNVGPTGSIQIAVNPASLSVNQGGSGSVNALLTRGGGFNGVVTLAVSGLPAGVTPTITPAQLSGTTTSATIDVTVAATVALGTYTATITATAQGVGQATATYQLTVTAAPDYALTVTPTELTIVAGASGSATVSIQRTNFTGEIALQLLNPPVGITGAFNPTPSTTNASALVVTVAANVAPGTYPLTIQGTATGPGVKTTTLTVTVPPPSTGGSIEYLFCSESATPVFVAYQDGDGPWQAVTGSSSGGATRFSFNLTQGRGGVMFVYLTPASIVAATDRTGTLRQVARPSGVRDKIRSRVAGRRNGTLIPSFSADTYLTEVLYGSADELAEDGSGNCALTQPTKTITGTVAGVPVGAYGFVSLGGASDIFDGGIPNNPMTFSGVPAGVVDFVGMRTIPGNAPNKVIVFRNLNLPDGGSLPSVIDFDGSAATAPATATATITGAAGDDVEIFTELVTANGLTGGWSDLSPSQITTRPWGGLAPATMVNGDYHGLIVFANPPDGSADVRVSLKFVGPVADQTLALGPAISEPSTSQISAGTYPRFRFQGTLPAEYNKGASLDVLSAESSGNVFSILATSSYLAAAGNALAYDFTMPDVAGLTGFPVASRLTAGTNDVSVSGFGFTGPGIFDLLPNLGSEFKAATKGATVNVP
jgi:hypothetical protein